MSRRILPFAGIFFLFGFIATFHYLSVWLIADFYGSNLPHYDSVGTLISGYRVVSAWQSGGSTAVWDALTLNRAAYALSMTQAYFAAFMAPILSKTPQSFQLYNTIAVSCGILGMYFCARAVGFRFSTSAAVAMLFLVPDGLWWWEFGLLDYRRDAGLFGFLTGSVFFLVALYVGGWSVSSRVLIAMALGLTAGLALISRDSAPLFVVGMTGMPALVLFARDVARNGVLSAVVRIAPAVLVGLPFAALLLADMQIVMARLADPLIAFGSGGDPWNSFIGNLSIPLQMIVGPLKSRLASVATLSLFALLTVAVVGAAACGAVRITGQVGGADGNVRPLPVLLAVGVWAYCWMHLFLSVYVGWRTTLPLTALMPPYLPTLIGFFAFVIAGLSVMQLELRAAARSGAVGGLAVLVLFSVYMRAHEKIFRTPGWMKNANDQVATLTRKDGQPPVFAELWFEIVQIPMVGYRAMQNNQPEPKRVRFLYHGRSYDTATGVPKDEKIRSDLLIAQERAVRCESDFIIVTSDISEYRNQDGPFLVHASGAELVKNLISELPIILGPFGVGAVDPVLVLDNLDRRACKVGN